MARYTPIPCKQCGAVGREPCVRGRIGSEVWKRKLPYGPGHSVRWAENKLSKQKMEGK